jgi:transcriptional regulator with XRE-family HTH domain
MAEQERRELGDFLRARRSRLTPESLGLPGRRRRRTPGLRREEVAELAGIGVDWYIRLEQGRPVTPSLSTIDGLARALRLTELEHQHLRALAGGGGHRPFQPETAPASLLRLLKSLTQPAYVTGRRRDLVAWNAAAGDILLFDQLAEDERNVLVSMLTNPLSRALFGPGWAEEAQRMVAQFRATHDLWAGDPAFVSLLRRLRDGCPEFAAWWERHDVRRAVSGVKTLHHPARGVIAFEHASFQVNDDPGLKLVIYTPVAADG